MKRAGDEVILKPSPSAKVVAQLVELLLPIKRSAVRIPSAMSLNIPSSPNCNSEREKRRLRQSELKSQTHTVESKSQPVFATLNKLLCCDGQVVRLVACEARGPGFDSSSDQMVFLFSGIGSRKNK